MAAREGSGRRAAPNPTDSELEILQVLWERGEATVRDVHEAIGAARGTGYTTILKLMQIMAAKGLVRRDESRRTHVYRAALPREATERRLVRALVDRAFAGSAARLVLSALSARPASAEELDEIRRLIDAARPGEPRPRRGKRP
ncbi:MAG: BlaI/MecI/CopY family transcriptional regulator [Acidobacteria bacterium]|nr:BlaI/MecI/CopY family transcriptional regulator [Acidobacteriota bacterium]